MATSDLEERLLELLSSEKPCAVALVGAWGVGKTHFWNSFLPRLAGVPTLSKRRL